MKDLKSLFLILLLFCIHTYGSWSEPKFSNQLIKLNPCYFNSDEYAILKKNIDGGYIEIENEILQFIYYEEYSREPNTSLDYEIYDYTKDYDAIAETELPVTFGENRYTLDLSNLEIQDNIFYTLQVTDQKGENWYLRFIIIPN
jgi:hypothetical protein